MNRSAKIISAALLAVIICVFSIIFFMADFFNFDDFYFNEASYQESDDAASFHDLNVNLYIDSYNRVSVVEDFNVTFNRSDTREVVRFIPYSYFAYRSEGTKVNKKPVVAKISSIYGEGDNNEKLNVYTDEISGYLTIGLKAATYIQKGETRHYKISYTYDMGQDKNKGFDDIYFNVVGTNSTFTIRNVSFHIVMPDMQSAKSLQMYYGKEGSSNELKFERIGNKISGKVEVLKPLHGITFRAVFEDGFLKAERYFNIVSLISIFVATLLIGLSVFASLKLKNRDKLIVPVELMSFSGLNAYIAEYMGTGNITDKSTIATIVLLASKGYITINQIDDKRIELIKKAPILDSEDKASKAIYNSIFKDSDKIEIDDLNMQFAVNAKAVKSTETIKSSNLLYDKKAMSSINIVRGIFMFLFVVSLAFMFFSVSYRLGFTSDVFMFRLVLISLLMAINILLIYSRKNLFYISLLLTAVATLFLILTYNLYGYDYIDGYYFHVISLVIAGVASAIMGGECKYAKEGAIVKGRVLGFKRFIKECEVEQIKMFASENPSLFYDVLPYAYVLGLSDEWIKKFESIKLDVPDWASANGNPIADIIIFNMLFRNFTTRTYKVNSGLMASQMHKTASGNFKDFGGSSFSGGFGGGGFSGGGGGGGGFGVR